MTNYPDTVEVLTGKKKIWLKKAVDSKLNLVWEHYCVVEVDEPVNFQSLSLCRPDIVVCEIDDFATKDLEFCKILKEHPKTFTIPVIIISSNIDQNMILNSIKLGIEACIAPPEKGEMLIALIDNLLNKKEKLKKLYYEEWLAQKFNVKESDDAGFIELIRKLTIENLDNPEFNVNELCDALAMSRSLVYKKVKKINGQTVVNLIQSVRMEIAAELLCAGGHKIFEVAYMVGFSDRKYFRRIFKQKYGVSPSEFRESN